MRDPAWAIQNGVSETRVERYLSQHNESDIAARLCLSVQTTLGAPIFPILYFAAERNSPEIVRILCHAGAKPTQSISPHGSAVFGLPLLPYAILSTGYELSDTTETVVALLAMGASPHDAPKDMWQDYLKALASCKDKTKEFRNT